MIAVVGGLDCRHGTRDGRPSVEFSWGRDHTLLQAIREVKRALRKTLFKYQLHQDESLCDKAYGYIKQYY